MTGDADVVVLGFGLAGAAAAIEACDRDPDARVVLVEKMPEELAGGNSRASAQRVLVADDPAGLAEYQRALNEPNHVPDEVVRAWAEGVVEVEAWLEERAHEAGMECVRCPNPPEFPELPGAASVSSSLAIVPAPAGVWRAAKAGVERRGVEVRYATRALELSRRDGVVTGVLCERDGVREELPARRGVVLASGGYENDETLLREFGGHDRVATLGTPANTGDGLRMLQRVGAALWHMRNRTHSGGLWPAMRVPGFEAAFQRGRIRAGSWLELAGDGQRFHDESADFHLTHAKRRVHGTWVDLPHSWVAPVHMVFDETVRLAGPLVPAGPSPAAGPGELMGWNLVAEGYRWSEDNTAELGRGWITGAASLVELGRAIGREPGVLEAAVERFNGTCDQGRDGDFGRDPARMSRIEAPPFYAVEIVPGITFTTGGGCRDALGRVLDVDGSAIPGLYEAGALGSTFSNLFQNGASLAECIVSGRAAGASAVSRR
jgi:succinate dehydrogenase/fumarate reductase flavoprotein subunit